MATKKQAAPGGGTGTAQDASLNIPNSTPHDRVVGWHALGAFAKQHQATKPNQGKRRPPMRGVKS